MGSKSRYKEDFRMFGPFLLTAAKERCGFLLGSSVLIIIFALIVGCAAPAEHPSQGASPPPPPLFPPMAAMQSGDYAGFYTENSEALKTCQDPDKCAEALFNLSFLCCYSKSPYYDPRQGLNYIDDLITAAPGSTWAGQARVWKDLIEKIVKKKSRKRQVTREDAKTKETEGSLELSDDSAKPDEVAQGKDSGADRQRIEDEISYRDEIINQLRKQLERSRQIDIEMEERERGLLP